jgi:SAM-dependent MidA family methyltransferase
MDRIARALRTGYVLTVDYGYTRAEAVRFPNGTLMGYRRHTALEDVLQDPGLRDITAHVNFTALEERGALRGLRAESFSTLAQLLLSAGEADQFAAALGPDNDLRRRMQLKTLLFGMGETSAAIAVKLVHRRDAETLRKTKGKTRRALRWLRTQRGNAPRVSASLWLRFACVPVTSANNSR